MLHVQGCLFSFIASSSATPLWVLGTVLVVFAEFYFAPEETKRTNLEICYSLTEQLTLLFVVCVFMSSSALPVHLLVGVCHSIYCISTFVCTYTRSSLHVNRAMDSRHIQGWIDVFIIRAKKFLKGDWLKRVVFQRHLKHLHVSISCPW